MGTEIMVRVNEHRDFWVSESIVALLSKSVCQTNFLMPIPWKPLTLPSSYTPALSSLFCAHSMYPSLVYSFCYVILNHSPQVGSAASLVLMLWNAQSVSVILNNTWMDNDKLVKGGRPQYTFSCEK